MTTSTTTPVHVLVRQVTRDPVAESAAYALIHNIGESRLLGVRRRDYWCFYWNAESAEAQQLTEWLLKTSTEFVHPSKHRWQVVVNQPIKTLIPIASPDAWTGVIWVQNSDTTPQKSLCESLKALYPECQSLDSVEQAVWWELTYPADIPVAERNSKLESLAESRSRTQGLLANPQYQQARILLS